ncbi:hypothetical protein JCM5350_003077 [Sporobolomyces pararoseus]
MSPEPSDRSEAASSTSQPQDPPQLPPLSRHHSRSSSQLATLASLSFSPTSPVSPRQLHNSPKNNISPRSSQFGVPNGISPWNDRTFGTEGDEHRRDSTEQVHESSISHDKRSDNIPSTSSSPASTNTNRKSALSDRRKTLPSIGSPSPLSHLISTASTPSPLPSPDQNHPSTSTSTSSSSSSNPFSTDPRQALPPTDPTTSAQTSFPSSSIGLAQLIQQKRRQASAPYFNTARTHQQRIASSPVSSSNERGSGFTVMSGGGSGGAGSNWHGGWGGGANQRDDIAIGSPESGSASPIAGANLELSQSLPPSRSRSRHGSRRSTTSGRLSLQTSGLHLALSDLGLSPVSMPYPETGDEGMVMTPTTEEWRSLGGKLSELADLRAKDEERLRKKEDERIARREKEAEDKRQVQEEEEDHQSTIKRKRNPLRPSLWDVSSDEDDDEDDSSDDLGLSLSLSRFTTSGKKKKQPLSSSPSSVSIPTPPRPRTAPPEKSPSNSVERSSDDVSNPRPTYSHIPKSSFSYSSTKTGGGFVSHSNTSSLSSISTPLSAPPNTSDSTLQEQQSDSKAPGSEPLPTVETFKPTHRPQKSESSIQLHPTNVARPALSRGSLTSATGGLSSPPIVINNQEDQGSRSPPKGLGLPKIPLPPNVYRSLEEGFSSPSANGGSGTPLSTAPTPAIDQDLSAGSSRTSSLLNEVPTPYEPPFAPPSPARDESGSVISAVDLDWTKPLGPVDPRTYSAVTGLRDISSFIVEREEAGKGAYGSVRRARERGPQGQPVGPELIIKYVIKQRILADCWKKHKILGPIPIEVHVLDHLRRVPYISRPRLRYMNQMRERRELHSSVDGAPARKRAGIVRRESGKPEIDLWNGGEDGGTVQTGHPNVCGLLDFFEDGEFYYLVMPQATASANSSTTISDSATASKGQDLFDFVDLHPTGLPPRPIARILSQVADALAFLHEHSIVHRDIKDENVVLDADGNVRLIDFGSAAYVKDGRFFDTFSGTLDFAAPEVLKGARYSGREQDVWALGVLGYVLICGECPFWSPEEAMRGLSPDSRALAQLQLKLPDSALKVGTPSDNGSLTEERGEEEPSIADAIDLVTRCLEIDLSLRPSADAVCDHTFLAGDGGWRGRRGWDLVESGGEEEGA